MSVFGYVYEDHAVVIIMNILIKDLNLERLHPISHT
jgi:hypothetical protein